mmetsp:Transcript_9893/g.27826  ORF Transcript_9893/g.27826 Transcript_9893/m.27826 type:complete len:376 (+) Transcript_9893:648-1775(+)
MGHPDPVAVDALHQEAAGGVVTEPPGAVEDVGRGLADEHEVHELLAAVAVAADERRLGVVHVLAYRRADARQEHRAHEAQDAAGPREPRVDALLEQLLRVGRARHPAPGDRKAARPARGDGRCDAGGRGRLRRICIGRGCRGHLAHGVGRRRRRVVEDRGERVGQQRPSHVLLLGGDGQRLILPLLRHRLGHGGFAADPPEEEVLHYECLDRREDAAWTAVALPQPPLGALQRAEHEADAEPPLHVLGVGRVAEEQLHQLGHLWPAEPHLRARLLPYPRLPPLLLRGGARGRRQGVLGVLAREGPRLRLAGHHGSRRGGGGLAALAACSCSARVGTTEAGVPHREFHRRLDLVLLGHLGDVHGCGGRPCPGACCS